MLESGCRGVFSLSNKGISKVQHIYWLIRSDFYVPVHLKDVGLSCHQGSVQARQVLPQQTAKTTSLWSWRCVMLKPDSDKHKLLTQSWKSTVVYSLIVHCSIDISHYYTQATLKRDKNMTIIHTFGHTVYLCLQDTSRGCCHIITKYYIRSSVMGRQMSAINKRWFKSLL